MRRLSAITCLLYLLVSPALASEFKFLRPGDPELRNFQPSEPISIRLPDGITDAELGNLYLELNGVDITQLVSLEGHDVIFYPPSPQRPGAHALRLVKMGRNGKIVELSHWNFNVVGNPALPAEAAVQGTVDATYSYLTIRDQGLDDGTNRHNLAATGKVAGSAQSGNWMYGLSGNAFANTEDLDNPDHRNVEVGEYLLSAERLDDTLSANFRLGQHDIGADNILFKDFNRRGASATFGVNGDQLRLTGFAMNPQRVIGNDNITGVQEHNQRAFGANATVQPVASWGDRLELESTIYRGEGSVNGYGVGSPDTETDIGSGYQLGLKAGLLPERVDMHLEYAHSTYDFDGRVGPTRAEDDRAYRTAFTFTPITAGTTADGKIHLWQMEASWQRAGSFYHTMGNSTLDPDRDTFSLKSNYLLGNLVLNGELAWVTDNVNGISTLPREGAFNAWLDGSYAPESEIWGQPVFTFGGKLSDEKRQHTPVGYAGPDLNRVSDSVYAGVTMSHDDLMWSLTQTYSGLRDQVTGSNNYNSNFTDLSFEYQAKSWLTLRPGLQYEWLQENADGLSHGWHLSLGADTVLLADTLYNNSNISTLINSGNTTQGDEYSFDTDFTWQIREASVNKPGYALSLYGAYTAAEPDASTDSAEDARVFLRLKLSAPFAF